MSLDKHKITVIEHKEVIIYNYEKIVSINKNKIIFDLYEIVGENLKIFELDGYQIRIIGVIKEIIFKYE